jgi:hypothetical protein
MTESAVFTKFRALARDGQQLALDIERGQASTPLADHFAQLPEQLQNQSPTVALVATQPLARDQALLDWIGQDNQAVTSHVALPADLVEVHLAEGVYALHHPDGQRHEFDDAQAFLQALGQEAQALRGTPARARQEFSVAAPPGGQGLTLLLPPTLDEPNRGPALSDELATRAHLLVLAHEADAPLPDERTSAWLRELAQGIGCLQAVWVAPAAEGASAARPASLERASRSWVDSATVLAPLAPTAQGLAQRCARLLGPLTLWRATRRLQLAAEALRDRLDQDQRQLNARKLREEAHSRAEPGADTQQRRSFDAARAQALDDLAGYAKACAESSKRAQLPDSPMNMALGQQLRSLKHEDLDRQATQKAFRLSLGSLFQAQLGKTLRRCLRDELREDLLTLRDGLDATRSRLEQQLEAASGTPVTLAVATPSETDLWGRIAELVNIEVRYRGEMPRRGFFQRLGEGRKAVFAGMMVLSLVGSFVGLSWRGMGLMGLAFLVAFLVVVALTYRNWRAEDEEKLDAELERVREQLQQESRRVAADVQREKQQRLQDELDLIKKALTQRIDTLMQDKLSRDQAAQAEQREAARLRLRKLDQQGRDLGASLARAQKLAQDTQAMALEAERAVRDAAGKLGVPA